MKLSSKRFGLMFAILNLISRDYLRNYLAIGVCLPLKKAMESNNVDFIKHEIERAVKGCDDIFNL